MRGANSYEPLHETHERVENEREEIPLPDARYEPLRETEREVAAEQPPVPDEPQPPPPADPELMDILAEIRATEPVDRQVVDAIDDGPAVQPASAPELRGDGLEDYVAPEEWTSRGGMVEQQASAMEWLEHSMDERGEREARQQSVAGVELTQEDREVLEAARASEAHVQEQELMPSQIHEHDGP